MKAIGSNSHLPKIKGIVEDLQEITKMYSPFTPNKRPWLVIIEVNMTDETRNTECTGQLTPYTRITQLKEITKLYSGIIAYLEKSLYYCLPYVNKS